MFFWQLGHFNWPFTQKSNTFNVPQIEDFTTNKIIWKCVFNSLIMNTSPHFGERIWDKLWGY